MKFYTFLLMFNGLSWPLMSSAYDQAYPKTNVGVFEIKTLPAAYLIASHSNASYFESNNGLFRPLFSYINEHGIAMTTPVEAEIEPGVMFFYVGNGADHKSLDSTDDVSVHKQPERTVASHGVRGDYSEAHFKAAASALRTWLADQKNYVITGNARGVFWNGPFMPSFLKRFEVHIPVK